MLPGVNFAVAAKASSYFASSDNTFIDAKLCFNSTCALPWQQQMCTPSFSKQMFAATNVHFVRDKRH